MDVRKLSKYVFFASLFLLPFQTVYFLREPSIGGEKWQYGTIGVYGADILLVVAIIFAVIVWKKNNDSRFTIHESEDVPSRFPILKSKIINQKSTMALALLALWAGLSIFWAPDQVLAGYFFVKLLIGAGIFFLARSLGDEDVRAAMKVLLAAAVIQAVIGIGQFVTQSAFASSLLGMSHHEAWQAGTSVLKPEGERWLRAYGSFPHPNMLGGFLAATFVLGISYLVFGVAGRQITAKNVIPSVVEGSRRKPRRFLDKLRMTIEGSVLIASLLTILLALILTFSRTAWLGALIGIVAYYVFCIQHFSHQIKSKCIIILRPWNYDTFFKTMSVLGIAAAAFVFILRDQVFPRFDGATIEREGSVSERMASLADAKALIAGHPFLGVGAGNFTKAVTEGEPNRPIWNIQPAHNVFVLVWAELGVVGVVLLLFFIGSVVHGVIPSLSRNPGILRSAQNDKQGSEMSQNQNVIFATAFLTLAPSLFLDHWLWSSHFGLLFFFLLAGLVARKN